MNPGVDRWGEALCWFPDWENLFFEVTEILAPQDSLVVPMYNYNVPRHLQPLGHTTQPVQERGGKCKKDLRGGRWAAPKPSNKPLHNSLLQVLELLRHYLQNSSRISSVLCFMLEHETANVWLQESKSKRSLFRTETEVWHYLISHLFHTFLQEETECSADQFSLQNSD